ncbi:HD-GYP domain, c-di-GMP phosphodiesterase class II (or its inactivated variant) [Marinitoga hydrogenitolerans DSM 16785]|uniref:HD-GYP domain, c-di-GMP phosphodiesterase class II (Or its inactivated variant) n=1 Tax=Marinitoga hydrogenitolerans (strain DSM 16785 / JCM 12826 / AT1271) TaxID=1122195 RepID=A0A1M4Y5W9_MARH1|nr:HD domain-containing phosphohydrolase [Marinitoga hydrogenitolerans]SHF01151.1 HD-GYP domain, c-di-GMP phosphodiesterase class II (or its inactivated variant) [Marinitoga hydrogenitolerans DSM 16785]
MKIIPLNKAKFGMFLAMDVRDTTGKIILKKGTEINETIIYKLKKAGIFNIPVKSANVMSELNKETKKHSVISKENLDLNYKKVKDLFKNLEDNNYLDIDAVIDIASSIKNDLENNFSDKLFVPLKKLRDFDEYLYSHSLNVMIISSLLAIENGIIGDELLNISISSLLHDIGKTKVPIEIMNAPRPLTEEEMNTMRNHVLYGKEIALENNLRDMNIIGGIYEHHERIDGRGYLEGKKNEQITSFGKIIAIADVYDALTSTRSYKGPWTPYKTISFILTNVEKQFDGTFAQGLINSFGIYPVGTRIQLNNGQFGTVVASNRANKIRPLIRIDHGDVVDLSEEYSLRIVKVLDYVYIE